MSTCHQTSPGNTSASLQIDWLGQLVICFLPGLTTHMRAASLMTTSIVTVVRLCKNAWDIARLSTVFSGICCCCQAVQRRRSLLQNFSYRVTCSMQSMCYVRWVLIFTCRGKHCSCWCLAYDYKSSVQDMHAQLLKCTQKLHIC